jgi:hypothetical protein
MQVVAVAVVVTAVGAVGVGSAAVVPTFGIRTSTIHPHEEGLVLVPTSAHQVEQTTTSTLHRHSMCTSERLGRRLARPTRRRGIARLRQKHQRTRCVPLHPRARVRIFASHLLHSCFFILIFFVPPTPLSPTHTTFTLVARTSHAVHDQQDCLPPTPLSPTHTTFTLVARTSHAVHDQQDCLPPTPLSPTHTTTPTTLLHARHALCTTNRTAFPQHHSHQLTQPHPCCTHVTRCVRPTGLPS